MSECAYRITGTNGSVFRVEVRGLSHNVLIDMETGAFGTIASIAEAIGLREERLYRRIAGLSRLYPSTEHYFRSVDRVTPRALVCSQRIINMAIDQCIEKNIAPSDAKTRFNKLYKEVYRFCSSDSSSATTDDTSDSLRRIETLEQTIERLTNIIARLLEIHPEVSFDEPVVIDKELIDNYIVTVLKNEDGKLLVETLNADVDLTDKDPLFSKEFYVSINDVDNLLTKLRDKEIITSMDEDAISVDDADFFISAFSYKLSKISDKNKDNDIESTSASVSP